MIFLLLLRGDDFVKYSCMIYKVYGQGSAKDCREHVQKLNMMKGMSQELSAIDHIRSDYEEDHCDEHELGETGLNKRAKIEQTTSQVDGYGMKNIYPQKHFLNFTMFIMF